MVLTCCCETCTVVRNITSWGSDSTTIGNGATEQNGDWEILSGALSVTSAHAIITWDAGIPDWRFCFGTGLGSSWEFTGALATDYTRAFRLIFNYVDNDNYDFVTVRLFSYVSSYSLASFGERSGGAETILHPVAGGGGAISQQFKLYSNGVLNFYYQDEVMRFSDSSDSCPVGSGGATGPDPNSGGRSWYRARVNNIVGIGTDPTWGGLDAQIDAVFITSNASSPCNYGRLIYDGDCLYPLVPTEGATNAIVALTVTATVDGTPYTCYPGEQGPGQWTAAVVVAISSNGDVVVTAGASTWTLTNGGSPRTDADSWSGLNIPPDSPETRTCTLTGNY